MSPATTPMAPKSATTTARLNVIVARSSPPGGWAGETNVSGSAIVVMRANVTRSTRPDTWEVRTAPARDPTAIAAPPVSASPRCTSAYRP